MIILDAGDYECSYWPWQICVKQALVHKLLYENSISTFHLSTDGAHHLILSHSPLCKDLAVHLTICFSFHLSVNGILQPMFWYDRDPPCSVWNGVRLQFSLWAGNETLRRGRSKGERVEVREIFCHLARSEWWSFDRLWAWKLKWTLDSTGSEETAFLSTLNKSVNAPKHPSKQITGNMSEWHHNIHRVLIDKCLSYYLMHYVLCLCVTNHTCILSFGRRFTVFLYGKEAGRNFARRQHKQTWTWVNLTQNSNSEEEKDKPRQNVGFVPKRGPASKLTADPDTRHEVLGIQHEKHRQLRNST